MADEVDVSNERQDFFTELAVKAIASRANSRELEPTGECYNCGAEFPEDSDKLFCDGKCAAAYERRKRQ